MVLLHLNVLIISNDFEKWLQITEGIPNATPIELNVSDQANLHKYVSKVRNLLLWGEIGL